MKSHKSWKGVSWYQEGWETMDKLLEHMHRFWHEENRFGNLDYMDFDIEAYEQVWAIMEGLA